MKATLRALWLVIATTVRASPLQSLICLAETASRALSALNPLFFGLFAAGAVHHDTGQIIAAVAGLVGTTAISLTLEFVGQSGRIRQLDIVGFVFTRQIGTIMASIETLDHQEDPELLDKLQMFHNQSGSVAQALNSLLNFLNTMAWAVTALTVALTADWRLVILALLGIPRILLTGRTLRWDRAIEEEGGPHSRRADRLVDMTYDVDAGAEIRVFGLQREMRRIIGRSVWNCQRPAIRYARNYTLLELINGLVYFGAAIGILAWMLHDAVNGTVGIQAITIALTTLGTLQNISGTIVSTVKFTAQAMRAATRFVWLKEYAAEVHARYTGDQPPPDRLQRGISLEHVSYRYNGSESDALSDITLDLPAGSVVALVGENGAGKSTLVKLLTGMYAPSHGRIRLDDTDLSDVDLTAWRERCSGAFQDHANFELTAGETVGIGEYRHIGDEPEVHRALRAGAAEDVLTALPDGLSTQLGTSWPGGVDLSGGQWQRLAIGRGMMRREPLLLALDEPTSALDAATEHALFERYAAAAHDAGRRGAVTLLVTHRFS
ncbi:MAG TPA: ABC transporter ATP-binding protein, partial [Mycobacteriales bacterium]|nr:ABC transporter ATP-binding protein [Mycobacteriales bacterium]